MVATRSGRDASPRLAPRPEKARPAASRRQRLASWLPVVFWPPNLVGYVRLGLLLAAVLSDQPAGLRALWCLAWSLGLDFIDGPLARKLGMCSQFGDLLDHVTDHLTMLWLVTLTTPAIPTSLAGLGAAGLPELNRLVNTVHNLVAVVYMLARGHYFKHTAEGNWVTRLVEQNNYWNLPATMYAANSFMIPLIKLSYAAEHSCLQPYDSTAIVDAWDYIGMLVTAGYTAAVLADSV